jgi:hypothetical protein
MSLIVNEAIFGLYSLTQAKLTVQTKVSIMTITKLGGMVKIPMATTVFLFFPLCIAN